MKFLSHVRLFVTPWTEEPGLLQSTEFFRQGYWSGLPFPPPGDIPDPGIEPIASALAGEFFIAVSPGNPDGDTTLSVLKAIDSYILNACTA